MSYLRRYLFAAIFCSISVSLAANNTLHRNALHTSINAPTSLALDTHNNLFVIEEQEDRVLRIDLKTGSIAIIAGTKRSLDCVPKNNVPANKTCLDSPTSLAVNSSGDLFIGELFGYVRKVDAHTGIITTIYSKSGPYSQIQGLTVDKNDNLFIGDSGQIFELDKQNQNKKLIAGQPKGGFSGDGGPARDAQFGVTSIAIDRYNNIAIADDANCRIRYIESVSETVNTIMATESVALCRSAGSAIRVHGPSDPTFDSQGNIYFIEGAFDLALRVDTKTHNLSKIAGNGDRGFAGDGGPATKAMLANPSGLAIDDDGNLYISEFVNNRIRRVDAKTGIITTIAGNGLPHRMDLSE